MTYEEFQKRYQYDPSADRLGGGGFGEVFKAYDTYRDRWVAIKIAKVLPEIESVRLKKEVELVSKLPIHPNIAYYEACHTFREMSGEYDFGILQYYEEGNLLQLFRRGQLGMEQKQSLLRQILSGLEFLHDNGIIHRDLKPQNILIVKRGNEYIPKITDFGISKKLDAGKSSVYSNSLVGAGTLAYSSPEQLGSRVIRKNTDLWSFGVIVCQLLTGELPFNTGIHEATSEAGRRELFEQINSGRLPDAIQILAEPWQSLVKNCLILDPEHRIQSAKACFALLDNAPSEEETIIDIFASPKAKEEDSPDETQVETPLPVDEKKHKTPEKLGQSTPPTRKKRNLKPFWITLIGVAAVVFFAIFVTMNKKEEVVQQPDIVEPVTTPSAPPAEVVVVPPVNNSQLEPSNTPAVSKEDTDWAAAVKRHSIAAYRSYLSAYPSGKYATTANNKIKELEEQERQEAARRAAEQLNKKRELLSRANQAFDAGKYDEAFNLYKEVKQIDPSDNTGYNRFLSLGKKLISTLTECDDFVKKLFNHAKVLNNTPEVNTLLSNCK